MKLFKIHLSKEAYKLQPGYFFFFLIVVQGLAIFLMNLTQTNAYLFPDNTLAIRHGIEIWRNGLFLDNFNYYSTLEIDNAAFFAIPLYFLTNHLGFSLGVVHLLLYILGTYLIYSIFQNGGYNTDYGLLASFFLFTPYVIGGLDWGNMLFVTVGQYEFRVLTLLSTTNLMLIALNKKGTRFKNSLLFIFHLLLCAWTTLSCGNYVILMILLPLCLFFIFINCITERLEINWPAVSILLGSLVVSGTTFLIRTNAIGETSRGALPLLTADTFSANLLNCITGFFMLFGGLTQEPNTPIFSINGILRIIKFVFACACVFITYLKFKRLKEKDYLFYMFLFVALVNLAVMLLAVTRYGALIYEYRYHIIWSAMLILTAAAGLDYIKYARVKILTLVALTGMAILINISGFNSIFTKTDAISCELEIIRIAEEENIDTIYVYNMPVEAAAIRVLEYKKNCMSVTYVENSVYTSTEDYFANYYDHYDYTGKHLFVCSPDHLFTIPEEIQNMYTQIGCIYDFNVYVSDENPWLTSSVQKP